MLVVVLQAAEVAFRPRHPEFQRFVPLISGVYRVPSPSRTDSLWGDVQHENHLLGHRTLDFSPIKPGSPSDCIASMAPAYQTSAVIFLDILGTKDRSDFDEKFAVHQVFHEEVKNNEERQAASPHVVYTRALRSFSDCAFILYTYKEGVAENRKDDLNLLYIALYNTSLSILRILNAGFLVRGGATLGDAFIDQLGFFGPAIEEAYELESQKDQAVFPRIILGDTVGERLSDWERAKDDGMASMMFKEVPRLILRDRDGKFFLNVFYQLEMSGSIQFGNGICTLESVKLAVAETCARTETKHADNEGILRKMAWMRGFTSHASSLVKDGVSPIQTFVLGAK